MPDILEITDPEDPRVAAYRDIKERDLVGRQGRFIAEGETVLRAFVRDAPERIDSLLIDGKRAGKLGELFAGLPAAVESSAIACLAESRNSIWSMTREASPLR